MADARIPPIALYDAEGARALDRCATARCHIPGRTLMQRAGAVVWETLRHYWPAAHKLVVVCGGGNNAGDGYVVARLAAAAGCHVQVLQVGSTEHLGADARQCLQELTAHVITQPWSAGPLADADVIVDAIFGIGIDREVTGDHAAAITAINAVRQPVISIDIPSGLDATSGAVMGVAVVAAVTVTFIARKQGLLTGAACDHVGELVCDDLDVPDAVYAEVAPASRRLRPDELAALLPPRRRSAHKGDHGHVLIVGGSPGFGGAVRMAGEAAGRIGAGLVSVATHPVHAASIATARPELMCHGVTSPRDLAPLLARASVIAAGPGLGSSSWATQLFPALLASNQPLVIDADALNLLAADPLRRDNWVLTPHPGEAARLLACDAATVQRDRFTAAREVQRRYGGVCVLKGCGTLVAGDPGQAIALCDAGNPGMGSGGMGDVLTGVIAGLAAQGLNVWDAARLGVWAHATAADRAAVDGERGLLAIDLMPWLRRLVN